jgi:4-hydroxybenzoate polyprenyltransferase
VWRAWLEQLRPACWLLFITHGYLGFIMGARAPLPAWDRFALDQRVWEWLAEGRDFWLALICLGPLLGGFSLLLDDLYDYETDRRNPRRCTLPTVQGILSSRTVRCVAWGQAGAGLLLALAISPVFFVLAGIGGALGWAYAAEPWRTKSRAGWDVVTNALGVAVICPLAGWSLTQPVGDFPWGLAVVNALGAAGAYIGTAIMDEPYDRAAGLRTIAVALGTGPAKKLGWALWLLYLFGLMGASALGYGLPRTLLPLVLGLSPFFVGQYARVLGAAGEPRACWRRVVELCALWHVLVLGLAILYAASS